MFSIFKKKAGAGKAESDETLTPVDHDECVAKAEALQNDIDAATGAAKADLLDEQGKLYADAGEVDLAIGSYEASIEAVKRMGAAYRGLTSLYNKKRAEAAANGDDEGIRRWLDRLETLMQSSKDMLRGK